MCFFNIDDTNLTCREDDKFVSTLPSRGERFESTQELLDSQTRLSAPKLSRHSHQLSDDKNRFRAYSAASRTSTGGKSFLFVIFLNACHTDKH